MSRKSQYIIDQICQKYKISDYLSSRGLTPVKTQAKRLFYNCPIHQETQPSFVLYLPNDDSQYENFYCFGCHASTSIIHLVAHLEYGGASGFRKAIEHLSKGLNLSIDGELDFILDELKKQIDTNKNFALNNPFDELSLQLSTLGHSYLSDVNFDKEECKFLEKVYRKIDEYIWRYDLVSLEEAYEFITEQNVFKERENNYIKNKENL